MNIDIEGVHVTLADTDILEAVDASVDEGCLVGLVGPNGAGKTTLLRSINAALEPDSGTVFVGDDDIHSLSSRSASRRLASVPQHTNLDFQFTVREVVAMGRHPHRSRLGPSSDEPDIIDAALERAQIVELADRTVTTLSGGERQRVLLARALAQDAPVLVLDEPTASLDIHHQIRTLGLVRDIVDDGRTGIAAIHDLDLAARFCDSLILIADGEVRAAGPPDAVLTTGRLRDAFGADTVITKNPVTGSPSVTVRDGERTAAIDARVHVVGGTSQVARFLPSLADAVTELTVGPVVSGGQDAAVASGFDCQVAEIEPYSTLDKETGATLQQWVHHADIVVVPDGVAARQVPLLSGEEVGRRVEPGPETTPTGLLQALGEVLDDPRYTMELPAD